MKQQGNLYSFRIDCMQFVLDFSDDDAEMLRKLCENHDCTVKQVLTQFVCDLVDSKLSGGSDERMMISEWFLRSFERGDVHG